MRHGPFSPVKPQCIAKKKIQSGIQKRVISALKRKFCGARNKMRDFQSAQLSHWLQLCFEIFFSQNLTLEKPLLISHRQPGIKK